MRSLQLHNLHHGIRSVLELIKTGFDKIFEFEFDTTSSILNYIYIKKKFMAGPNTGKKLGS